MKNKIRLILNPVISLNILFYALAYFSMPIALYTDHSLTLYMACMCIVTLGLSTFSAIRAYQAAIVGVRQVAPNRNSDFILPGLALLLGGMWVLQYWQSLTENLPWLVLVMMSVSVIHLTTNNYEMRLDQIAAKAKAKIIHS